MVVGFVSIFGGDGFVGFFTAGFVLALGFGAALGAAFGVRTAFCKSCVYVRGDSGSGWSKLKDASHNTLPSPHGTRIAFVFSKPFGKTILVSDVN